mgnify:CR=1 FL=1
MLLPLARPSLAGNGPRQGGLRCLVGMFRIADANFALGPLALCSIVLNAYAPGRGGSRSEPRGREAPATSKASNVSPICTVHKQKHCT